MLQIGYSRLDAAERLNLIDVANNHTLYQLIDIEIEDVRDQLCGLTPGSGLDLPYAVMQQRLISLQDLKKFFKQVRTELTPQQNTE